MFHNHYAGIFDLRNLLANLYVLNSVLNPFHISEVPMQCCTHNVDGYMFLPMRGLPFRLSSIILLKIHFSVLTLKQLIHNHSSICL
jgi:hypothetical protein